MTDQEKVQAATDEAAEDARDNRAHKILLALGISGFLGVLLLAGALLWQNGKINTLVASGNDTASQAQQLAQQVRSLGGTPVVSPASPGPQGPTGATGAQGPGPTDEQLDAAVTRYLEVHPPAAGQSATPAMVATAVAEFLTANPPSPGRPPTAQEIATAASTYLAAHTTEFQGPTGAAGAAGQNGANGHDATDAQVAAAVDAYCTTHNGCAGPAGSNGTDGATGPQGVSVTDVSFARDSSGACQVVVTLHDPATGTDTKATHSAGDAACPLITANAKATR